MESFMFLVFKSIFKSGDKLTLGAQCPPDNFEGPRGPKVTPKPTSFRPSDPSKIQPQNHNFQHFWP